MSVSRIVFSSVVALVAGLGVAVAQPVVQGSQAKRMLLSAALAAMAAACAPASAATTISGKYIVTVTKLCQMVDTYQFGSADNVGNFVDGIETSGSSFKQSLYTATFSPAKGTVSIAGFDDGGDIEIFQLTGAVTATLGSPIVQAPNSAKTAYSNTDTSITLGGQTFNAMYGQVSKKGVAGYVAFQGVFPSDQGNMCTEQGVAQAQ
jgi:hypothetical protein